MSVPVRLVVWSDFLCPWCWVAATRLWRVVDAQEGRIELVWKSFLLRPQPDPSRTLEKFRAYTQTWARPAAEPDAPPFRVWEGDAGPPSHSVPPHLVAKAAALLGPAVERAVRARLFEAYFAQNHDVTHAETLVGIWDGLDLPRAAFARAGDEAILEAVVAEHNEAVALGLSGVPAVMLEGGDTAVPGALPYETYAAWVRRLLAA
ncbi:MAG: DsbA family protein [bacterium]|nr:DsbA family protein [bacterium]